MLKYIIVLFIVIVIILIYKYPKMNIPKQLIKKSNIYCNQYCVPNVKNPPNNMNSLENKYYIDKSDCMWNNNCELRPNEYNFYAIPLGKISNQSKLACNPGKNIQMNCSNYKLQGCFKNNTCPCQEQFPAPQEERKNKCVEGFLNPGYVDNTDIPRYNNKCPDCYRYNEKYNDCEPICRHGKTGICEYGVCYS